MNSLSPSLSEYLKRRGFNDTDDGPPLGKQQKTHSGITNDGNTNKTNSNLLKSQVQKPVVVIKKLNIPSTPTAKKTSTHSAHNSNVIVTPSIKTVPNKSTKSHKNQIEGKGNENGLASSLPLKSVKVQTTKAQTTNANINSVQAAGQEQNANDHVESALSSIETTHDKHDSRLWNVRSNTSKVILAQYHQFTSLGGKKAMAKCKHCPDHLPPKHFKYGNNTNLRSHLCLVSIF